MGELEKEGGRVKGKVKVCALASCALPTFSDQKKRITWNGNRRRRLRCHRALRPGTLENKPV